MQADRAFTVEDVEYLRHGERGLLARIYRPSGHGPFPCVIELHGGAWSQFDRTRGVTVHEALVRSGVVVVALDFRQGDEGAYPLSVSDVNYGIRWAKANAAMLGIDPARVAISGNSTGGHLAMLVAMRPADPRYTAQALPPGSMDVDASVRCVAMLWPVINPLGRYRYARRLLALPQPPEWCERIAGFHESYWKTEEAMAEGSPLLALERRETPVLAPALWLQSTQDQVHVYVDEDSDFGGTEVERFAERYRNAGGQLDVMYFDAPMMFTTAHPMLPASIAAMDVLCSFIHAHTAPV